jgi:putative transposase
MDAIFYLRRGGCAGRLLPHDFPPWQIVYQDFWRWRHDGTWQCRHDLRRGAVRVAAGKRRHPSAAIIARQSVKTPEQEGSVGTMPANRSKAASGIFSSIPWD